MICCCENASLKHIKWINAGTLSGTISVSIKHLWTHKTYFNEKQKSLLLARHPGGSTGEADISGGCGLAPLPPELLLCGAAGSSLGTLLLEVTPAD